jgi:hypothetical protein
VTFQPAAQQFISEGLFLVLAAGMLNKLSAGWIQPAT